jgi:tetratricopeptide (TPR) repeat protein
MDGYQARLMTGMVAAALCMAGSAWGQYQKPLDNNLQAGSGGINAPKAANTAGQYGNSIITGNVGGLGGFHGNVRYRAPGEFGSRLGSDSTLDFRLRSIPTQPIEGRGGYIPGGGGYVNPQLSPAAAAANTFGRPGAGINIGQLSGQGQHLPGIAPFTNRSLDVTGANFSPIGSSLGTIDAASLRPQSQAIGYVVSPGGQVVQFTTSPLMGIQQVRIDPLQRLDVQAPGAGQPPAPAMKPSGPGGGAPAGGEPGSPAVPGAPVEPAGPTGVDDPRGDVRLAAVPWGDALGERLAAVGDARLTYPAFGTEIIEQNIFDPKVITSGRPGDDVYADLLRRIQTQGEGKPGASGAGAIPPDQLASAPAKGAAAPAKSRTEQIMEEYERFKRGELTADQMRSGAEMFVGKLDYRLPPMRTMVGGRETGLNNALSQAEKELQAGNYFKAQAAYSRAIALNPDNPLAQLGQVHSQMGAGVYMSAAVNLRDVLAKHPEMIAAKYGESLLPAKDRLGKINDELETLMSTNSRPEAALLAAYIAFQQDRSDLMRRSLDELSKRSPNDPLVPLLRRIWSTSIEFKPRLAPEPEPAEPAAPTKKKSPASSKDKDDSTPGADGKSLRQ